MKLKINNSIFFSLVMLLSVVVACNDSDDLLTENAKEGGLLTATSQSLNYVVGNPDGPYTLEFFVNQGNEKIKSIRLYKSFTSTVTYTETVDGKEVEKSKTLVSNEVLDRTLPVTETKNHYVSASYTLDDLIGNLSIANLAGEVKPLPENDGLYQIGDKWVFRIESVLDDDRVVQQGYTISVSVSTRYAGKYRAVAAEYYRIGVLTYTVADWPAETVIESVDATTYRVLEYFGAAAFTGNEYYFQIVDGVITYPAKTPTGEDQTGNDQPFITCQSNPVDMAPVHCESSNKVINDDVNGKDRLIMSFGYYTAGSGPRTFYQVLEKIVE